MPQRETRRAAALLREANAVRRRLQTARHPGRRCTAVSVARNGRDAGSRHADPGPATGESTDNGLRHHCQFPCALHPAEALAGGQRAVESGYRATHTQAVRDLAEMRAAFQIAVSEMSYENDLPINALATFPGDPEEPGIIRAMGCIADTCPALRPWPLARSSSVEAWQWAARSADSSPFPLEPATVGRVDPLRLGVGECRG